MDDDQMQPKFLQKCQTVVEAIWWSAKPMTIDGNNITGPSMLLHYFR